MKGIFLTALCLCSVFPLSAQNISEYDVVWDTPSKNSSGSMPLGNGELGMNAWVEPSGDLLFYLSRTDALSEVDRLMKIGRIRISFGGSPLNGENFSQRLNLKDGVIEIKGGKEGEQCNVKLFMDANNDVAYAVVDSEIKRAVKVTAESWRRSPYELTGREIGSTWTFTQKPDSVAVIESADVFLSEKKGIGWYHINDSYTYDITINHQELNNYKDKFKDIIAGRIFGAYISSNELKVQNDSTLFSPATKQATIQFSTLSDQMPLQQWTKQIKNTSKKSNATAALESSRKWWREIWNRSYIYVDIPSNKELGYKISQAYALQRFMAVSSARGNMPIKFNGSIFNVDPVHTDGTDYSADYRAWGNCFWWQNTRLPYYAMIMAGDFDLMHSLFDFYLDRMDAFKTLASKYYGAKGFFIPETVTVFGTYGNGDWGWDRTGVTSNDVLTEWVGKIWVQSIELSKLMLDYYFYTNDEIFLKEKAIPTIKGTLEYFESRFVKDGKMSITPTQSLETYWTGVVNDMPSVVGLHYLVNTVDSIPSRLKDKEFDAYVDMVEKTLPAIPMKSTATGQIFKPATLYVDDVRNSENPELYPLFPFGLANFTNDLKDVAKRTFERRISFGGLGWGQDGQHTAMLGLTDQTVANLISKVNNTNRNQRFLAMWGPNADWVPDQDHGSNLLMVLQYMIMQNYNNKNYVLPTWPDNWNVSFKLAAPGESFVEGEYKDGQLTISDNSASNIVKMK